MSAIFEFCFSGVGAVIVYLVAGFLTFLLIRALCKRTEVKTGWLDATWSMCASDPIGWIFWPYFAGVSLIALVGEIFHVRGKSRKEAQDRQAAAKATKFSRMSMEELLSEQRKALQTLGSNNDK